MSIAKRSIIIPKGVKLTINLGEIQIESPKGKFSQKFPSQVEIIQQGNTLLTKTNNSENLAKVGTANSLIFNALNGITKKEGYQKVLEVKGVGYKVSLQDKKLEFSLGKSHRDYLDVPLDLEVTCSSNNQVTIRGFDKQRVGWLAAKIRDFRRPSIYKKDNGIYYQGEDKKIKLKPGKTVNK